MGRKKAANPIWDTIEALGYVPWWIGVGLALLSFVILNQISAMELAPATTPDAIFPVMAKSGAAILRFVVPIVCLVGAANSILRRRKRSNLIADVAQSQASDAIHRISWREFEALVGEAFRLGGYQVIETGGGGADGGVDLALVKGGERFLVQCKQWKSYRVGVGVVRELYGVMAARGATGGFVVTSGQFTEDATAFASGRNLKLIDGAELLGWIRQVKGSASWESQSTTQLSGRLDVPIIVPTAPACPNCSTPMIRRIARRGAKVGSEFWGCPKYPACRGLRQLVG